MNLSIFTEQDLMDKQIIVLYPNHFQPMCVNHREEYLRLCRNFGKENVFVITNDIQDDKDNIFSLDEKQQIMKRHGIENIKIVKNIYRPDELFDDLDETNTIVIYAMDNDNLSRLKGIKRLTKYNKTSNLPYKDVQNPYIYYVTTNNVNYDIPTIGKFTNDNIRKALGDENIKISELKRRFISIFGWFDDKLFKIIMNKMNSKFGNVTENEKSEPLQLVTRKFWDKVYESVITEEVEQINEVATKQFIKS